MNTTAERLTLAQSRELQRLDRAILKAQAELAQILAQKIEYHQAEIAKAEAELETLDLRLFANTMHVFTLVFTHGEVTLVEVHGAPTQYQARKSITHAFTHCEYTVLDDDQSKGQASGAYRCWYSSASQEVNTHRLMEEELRA